MLYNKYECSSERTLAFGDLGKLHLANGYRIASPHFISADDYDEKGMIMVDNHAVAKISESGEVTVISGRLNQFCGI